MILRELILGDDIDYAWHIDGNDKLKLFDFAIHVTIDDYSKKILWLRVLRSNNSSSIIGNIYLDCMKEFPIV